MSRTIDPREQHAGRRRETPEGSQPLSAAVVLRDELRLARDPRPERRFPGQPRSQTLPVPDGAEPVVVRSTRGVIHRGYREKGRIKTHARCHVSPIEVMPKGAEYDYDILRRPGLMCRYPWCFRDLLDEMGVDTYVGHVSRKVRAWRPSEPREVGF